MRLLLCLLCFSVSVPLCLSAQSPLDQPLGVTLPEMPLPDALRRIEQATEWRFSYSPQDLPATRRVALRSANQSLRTTMNTWLRGTGLRYRLIGGQVVIFRPRANGQRRGMQALVAASKFTLSGYLRAANGEPIAGATVYDSVSRQGSYSNRYGFFSLSREAGPVVLLLRAANYQPRRLTLTLQGDSSLSLALQSRYEGTVQIDDSMAMAEEPMTLGLLRFPVERLEEVPTLLGEPDVLKALALTPGVSLGIEGSSGLIVRGGTPDQNLIRLDGARLYNVTHLLGFVSAFNADALQGVDLYKGNFPARYGGRLASVLDLRMREGNAEEFQGEAGVGLLSSRVSVEGPLGERTSYLLTARSSYLTLAAIPLAIGYRNGGELAYNYWLYDFNGKVNHRFRDGSRLYFSAYHGQDWYTLREGTFEADEFLSRYNWINQAATLRYTRALGQRWFWEAQANFSRYYFQRRDESRYFAGSQRDSLSTDVLDARNAVRDWTGRSTLDFYPGGGHRLQVGVQGDLHRFLPRDLRTQQGSLDAPVVRQDTVIPALHAGAWVEDRWRWGPLELEVGLRGSLFQADDTTFGTLEPRVRAALKLGPSWQVSASYGRQAQYIHLLTATNLGLPGDVYIPANRQLPPQRGDQLSAGVAARWPHWTLALEGYYRRSEGQVRYRPPFLDVGLVLEDNWPELIQRDGQARAYGVEFLVDFDYTRLSGWLGYTWSRSLWQFPGEGAEPSPFDRPHQLDFSVKFRLTKRKSLFANWVFQSGRPVYLPVAQAVDLGELQPNFLGRQPPTIPTYYLYQSTPQRTPTYHRLDLGYQVKRKGKDAYWRMGVYNLYNRVNVITLDVSGLGYSFNADQGTWRRISDPFIEGTGFLPILPYLGYSWEF